MIFLFCFFAVIFGIVFAWVAIGAAAFCLGSYVFGDKFGPEPISLFDVVLASQYGPFVVLFVLFVFWEEKIDPFLKTRFPTKQRIIDWLKSKQIPVRKWKS